MIGFFAIGLVIFTTIAIMLSLFTLYIVDSKVRDEYARVSNIANTYRLAKDSGNDELLSVLNTSGTDYVLIGDDGNVINENGDNTCDLSSPALIDIINEEITVYPDSKMRVIYTGTDKEARVDAKLFMGLLYDFCRNSIGRKEFENGSVRLPLWIEMPIEDGTKMICKMGFTVYFRELVIISLLAAAVLLQTLVMFVFMIIFFCSNIRKRKRMTEVFFMDETTGKNNWLWFLSNAEHELKKKQNSTEKFAVLDVVFVNYRNYCVSHSVKDGEKMLCEVYDVIVQNLEKHEMAAHHSAAHFAVLLTYEEINSLEVRIWELIRKLEKINDEHKFSFWVGVDRIGSMTETDRKGAKYANIDIEKEYNNAGAARATLTGDDSAIAFFDEKIIEEQKWMDIVNENQQRALDNEEFVVYYQPKYDPGDRILKGAEALIRWVSPEHGTISPGRFIPIFEKNGFITRIDHYMLKHVAQDQKMWLDKGCRCVPVSVNVSRAHFIESDLAEQIRDIVDEAGTPHDMIELELTESAFFDDKKAIISTIRKLREYGFTVSMDDFGSGYSSLNSLKEMPLDVLKLDADFFRNDEGDGRGQIVVAEAIRLAKNLNMKTVAEGVEVKEQVEFLAEQGCDMIQGFYFAKPMPKDDFEKKMAEKFSMVN